MVQLPTEDELVLVSQPPAIRDLSLEVNKGEFVCLLGASGCGKSTLLNIFAGFVPPSAGRVLVHGEPTLRIEPLCGIVFQSYALFPLKTVRGNVEFGLKMRGVPAGERRRIAEQFIELGNSAASRTAIRATCRVGCSRGSVSRILAADPEVLLMD